MSVERERVRVSRVTEQPEHLQQRWVEGPATKAEDLRIQLLGDFRLWVGSHRIEEAEWYLRKPKHLVQLLALTDSHRMTRVGLSKLLWPGLDQEMGLHILGKAAFIAQRVFQPGLPPTAPSSYLHIEREWIILAPPGLLWVDIVAFRQAVQSAQETQNHADYERALRLYQGDLLPDDRFEDWTIEPRERLKALRLTLQRARACGDRPCADGYGLSSYPPDRV